MTSKTKVKNIQRILNEEPNGADLEVDGIIGPKTEAAFDALKLSPIEIGSGKGSWYSQYEGKYSWVDTGDDPNSNALGVPDDEQGIAFLNQSTLGKWFFVTAPNGRTLKLQQTDIGPSKSTGRKIDIAAVAAEAFGYSPKNFPTDGIFKWRSA
jgi:hypothetical protein